MAVCILHSYLFFKNIFSMTWLPTVFWWGILLVLWAYVFLKLFFAGKKASVSTDDHKVDDDDNFDEFLEGMFPW